MAGPLRLPERTVRVDLVRIAALLVQEIFKRFLDGGYKKMEISWILEDNSVVRRIFDKAGLEVKKRHALYDFALT